MNLKEDAMLEKVDLTKKISKEEYKAKMPQMEIELGRLQRECRELKIPVMIVFEGFGASGKGVQIGKLIQSMDHRMIAETFHIDHTRPIQIKNGLINSFHVNPL